MKTAVAVAATDLSDLPLILTLSEVAEVYRISQATVRRGLQDGTFRPRPFEKYPYRWRKEAVVADLRRDRGDLPRRAHGFAAAAVRRRPIKASLKPKTANARRAR